ncbi:hypothetical protein SG34_025485 [Thalassomonas viridans]|uniref:Adenosine deaminase domain-containing protein n=1 Tax=Thalassomonas viridans TaxID=137584 RepID=A0AAE9Z244_9GAMM|nr:hypothetical protein [Thalassomonas viridans]WDE04644.1 hypothetical protein SG34_025485 [Thalassomonas viridans]
MPYINQFLLSEPRLYQLLSQQMPLLLSGKTITLDSELIKQVTYASWQQRHYTWPDQVFHGHWRNIERRKTEEGGWSNALLGQAARYHFEQDDRRLAIQSSKFDQWQSWIANQTGLPVIAYQITQQLHSSVINDQFLMLGEIKSRLGYRALVSPYHPLVEDYIDRNGLHEAHMHLNGTTLLEQLWHHSLLRPQETTDILQDEYKNNKRVQLLYSSNPHLSKPSDFYHLLNIARQLRELLLCWLTANEEQIKLCKQGIFDALSEKREYKNSFSHEKLLFEIEPQWVHIAEIHWQVQVLNQLKSQPDTLIDTCFLFYLLCMNCFQRLLVQRSDQYGFDQFQKFADDGVREDVEESFTARFFQLHGPKLSGRPDIATLEGRFAPKKNNDKNIKLLSRILHGFLTYAEGESPIGHSDDLNELANRVTDIYRPNLRLVAHFIKKQWKSGDGGYHFQSLRESLINQGTLLVELLTNTPALKKIVTGIDAAANELEAPPEVFSCLYRFARYKGIKNFTYHAGEDFEHLLSGIRAVYDALNLLELKNGDRIGHATAIGICPQIWLNAMPERIFIKKGQWLDDLLFLRQIALSRYGNHISLDRFETQIRELAATIYNAEISIEVLQEAFKYRYLSPDIVADFLDNDCISLTGWLYEELQLVKAVDRKVLECLKLRWFDELALSTSEDLIEISLTNLPKPLLITAQQYVQRIVSERHIVIETLPTSNVRISHYDSITQHHIFRWLGLPERKIPGDTNMLITLGSDDPGIFATDMRNEFYHIFCTLNNEFECSPHLALEYASKLNENGRIYRFDYQNEFNDVSSKGLAEKRF